jgi:hypothetical protein
VSFCYAFRCTSLSHRNYCTVFVAQDPDSQSIVVAHQGTDPEKILSIANDAKFIQVDMNSTIFPKAAGV